MAEPTTTEGKAERERQKIAELKDLADRMSRLIRDLWYDHEVEVDVHVDTFGARGEGLFRRVVPRPYRNL